MKDFLNELLHADSIADVLTEYRKEAVKLAAVIVLALLIVLLYLHQSNAQLEISEAEAGTAEETKTAMQTGETGTGTTIDENGAAQGQDGNAAGNGGIIYVDIGGAVEHPMLAELPDGSRVDDAIEAAGGVTKKADLTGINRAQVLTDGEKIYIPEKGESVSDTGGNVPGGMAPDASDVQGSPAGGRININTADVTALQQLTGVGPVTAQKIVDYREQNGKFQTIEELKNISGIGDKTFEKMRDDVTI